jgi:hypothetical protein
MPDGRFMTGTVVASIVSVSVAKLGLVLFETVGVAAAVVFVELVVREFSVTSASLLPQAEIKTQPTAIQLLM